MPRSETFSASSVLKLRDVYVDSLTWLLAFQLMNQPNLSRIGKLNDIGLMQFMESLELMLKFDFDVCAN